MQGGEEARKAMNKAIEQTLNAATMTTMPPKMNPISKKLQYDQRSEVPRNRILTVIVEEVNETPMHGSVLPQESLRREPPKVTFASSSEEDAKFVVKTIMDEMVTREADPDKYVKVNIFGTGRDTLKEFRRSVQQRGGDRKRDPKRPSSVSETQSGISQEHAPVISEA
jgi:hypothetical protein